MGVTITRCVIVCHILAESLLVQVPLVGEPRRGPPPGRAPRPAPDRPLQPEGPGHLLLQGPQAALRSPGGK